MPRLGGWFLGFRILALTCKLLECMDYWALVFVFFQMRSDTQLINLSGFDFLVVV